MSDSGRFPPVRVSAGSEVDLVAADRRSWKASGQPLTAYSPRFGVKTKAQQDELSSPGPGTYIKQKVWEKHAQGLVSPNGNSRSARRRLDVSDAAIGK